MEVYFVLNERGEPIATSDVEAWSRWFERADRGIARTVVTPDVLVLTTFSGFDEPEEGREPLLFGSRVFGGVLDGEEIQHPTRGDALAGHASLVEWCRVANAPDKGITDEQIT